MLSRKFAAAVACGSAAALLVAGCASTSNSASSPQGSSASLVQISPQPDNKGQAFLNAIGSAKKTVDIVVYSIGDPQVTAALVGALKNNVAVRIIVDGYNSGQNKYNALAVQGIYQAAVAAGVAQPKMQANFSNTNFNITHQKSLIVDGQPNSGGNPQLVISTGNFSAFQGKTFWQNRDFEIATTNPNYISQVQSVFNSDWSCPDRTVTNNLAQSNPLVWSNGSTGFNQGDPAGSYPLWKPTAAQPNFGYFMYGHQSDNPVNQGTSRSVQLALLNGAQKGDVVRVYNEEQASDDIQKAELNAIAKGANVQVIETYDTKGKKMANLTALATAGATINVMAPDSVPGALYIHAKMVSIQPANGGAPSAYVGSSNFSDPSLNDNRELGIQLGANDADQIAIMNSAFDTDYKINGTSTTGVALAFMMNSTNKGLPIPDGWVPAAVKAGPDPDVPLVPQDVPNSPTYSACGAIPLTPAPSKKK